MHSSRIVEIWVGVFVALGMAALLGLAFRVSNISAFRETKGYKVTAEFDNVGGLKAQAPVTMAGVTVGRVASIKLDKKTFQALVTMMIYPQFNQLPSDTSASILTAGLLGEQYVGLSPGGDTRYLKAGDEIKFTQSALVLEQLISQFLYNKASGGKSK